MKKAQNLWRGKPMMSSGKQLLLPLGAALLS